MSSNLPTTGGSLETAFRRFESAATQLQERHGRLREQVEQLEARLADADRQLETVFDVLSSGVAVIAGDGTVLRTNRAFERMELVRPSGRLADSPLVDLLDSVAAGGSTRFRTTTATGERDLAVTLTPVGDELGTRVIHVEDVTDIRREEEEGGRRQRLEALGRMAAELAHEVRNPLGCIRLFAGMLHEDLEGDPPRRRMAEQILAAGAGLEATVSNLLSFAAPSHGELREVDLVELAGEVCALLDPACSLRGVRLAPPPPGSRLPVAGDPEALRQVLLNLVGNSLAATESGGSIVISVEAGERRAVLTVRDSGRGIPPDELPHVFDPFFSRSEGGTGLGLSIVHGIVTRHGGRITLHSQPNEGTRARLELPLGPPSADGGEEPHDA